MRRGFTLLELSIVLVVIALIIGGVVTGQSLIRASEVNSVISDFNKLKSANNTFKLKYGALPGDMSDASSYWGALDGGDGAGSDCFTLEATSTATCNGNGNGYISVPTGGTGVWQWGERFTYWQHLANAGLISGKYTGRTDSTTDSYVITAGKNSPVSEIPMGMWGVYSIPPDTGNANAFAWIGGVMYTLRSTDDTALSPLYADEAYSIDVKIDDGKAGKGIVRTAKNSSASSPGCATTDDEDTAEYDLDYRTNRCHARFAGDF